MKFLHGGRNGKSCVEVKYRQILAAAIFVIRNLDPRFGIVTGKG